MHYLSLSLSDIFLLCVTIIEIIFNYDASYLENDTSMGYVVINIYFTRVQYRRTVSQRYHLIKPQAPPEVCHRCYIVHRY